MSCPTTFRWRLEYLPFVRPTGKSGSDDRSVVTVLQVYEAENLIDGQLALDELRAGGLQAVMKGQYLSGAVGELPTAGLVTIWIVEPLHEQRALDLIAGYERDKRRQQPPAPCPACGEMVDGNFGRCWNCNAWLDSDPD